jgi:hypothetical protein
MTTLIGSLPLGTPFIRVKTFDRDLEKKERAMNVYTTP